MDNAILVVTTVGSEQQAITIAEELIAQELVASINILPTMRSLYRFNGKIFDDEENMLVMKTTESLFDAVSEIITQLHTYEIPEIMAIKADKCQGTFLDWVNNSVHFQ